MQHGYRDLARRHLDLVLQVPSAATVSRPPDTTPIRAASGSNVRVPSRTWSSARRSGTFGLNHQDENFGNGNLIVTHLFWGLADF